MKRTAVVLFVLGFGLLPIWLAAAIVYRGSLSPLAGSEYWNAAPWLIVFAIPVSAVTLAIAALTILVYRQTSGDVSRKWRFSVLTFGLAVVGVAMAGAALWSHYQRLQDQGQRVVAFASSDREVRALVGSAPSSRLAWTQQITGSPVRYGVAVTGTTTVYAIVDASSGWFGASEFTLACITIEDPRDDPSIDACAR